MGSAQRQNRPSPSTIIRPRSKGTTPTVLPVTRARQRQRLHRDRQPACRFRHADAFCQRELDCLFAKFLRVDRFRDPDSSMPPFLYFTKRWHPLFSAGLTQRRAAGACARRRTISWCWEAGTLSVRVRKRNGTPARSARRFWRITAPASDVICSRVSAAMSLRRKKVPARWFVSAEA